MMTFDLGIFVLASLVCASAEVWKPVPLTTWQWQLTGKIDTSFNVQMYDIDLFDASPSIINGLHSRGIKVICYFSAGSWENWRVDGKNFSAAIIGNTMDGWPDEKWLDVRSEAIKKPLSWRMQYAKQKNCDGVEPDNVDAFSADSGFAISAQDQLKFNKWLAAEAHSYGLSVGLKNDVGQLKNLVGDFDWALNEQCNEFKECDGYTTTFIAANKAVFGVEYAKSLKPSVFCPKMNQKKLSWLKKNHDQVDARRVDCQDQNTWNATVSK